MTTRKLEKSAAATASTNGFSLISDRKLIDLYTIMVKCRMLDERACALAKKGKLKGKHEAIDGHEAALVGALIDLQPEDAIAPSQNDLAANFIKGAPLEKVFRSLLVPAGNGRRSPVRGSSSRKAVEPSSAVAAQLTLATDIAAANKAKKNGKVVLALSGDLSTPVRVWHNAWNAAGVQSLPIVFVCRNHSPMQKTEMENIAARAQTYGFPGIAVDGSDVVAVYRVASEAIAKARAGSGATFIECRSYRRSGTKAKAQDPILNMEKYLAGKGLYKAQWKREIGEQFGKELEAAIFAANGLPNAGRVETPDGVSSCTVRERILNPEIWTAKN